MTLCDLKVQKTVAIFGSIKKLKYFLNNMRLKNITIPALLSHHTYNSTDRTLRHTKPRPRCSAGVAGIISPPGFCGKRVYLAATSWAASLFSLFYQHFHIFECPPATSRPTFLPNSARFQLAALFLQHLGSGAEIPKVSHICTYINHVASRVTTVSGFRLCQRPNSLPFSISMGSISSRGLIYDFSLPSLVGRPEPEVPWFTTCRQSDRQVASFFKQGN